MSEPIKRKRGRSTTPFTDIKEEIQWLIGTNDSDRSRERFSTMKHDFVYFGVSQQSQLLLRKIAFSPEFEVEPVRFLKLLNQKVSSLLLNELEVVVLALYLENLRWVITDDNLQDFVFFAAFAVKKYMNQDIAPILSQIQVEDPDFLDKFEYWHNLNKKSLQVKPKVLNRRYRELTQPIHVRGDNRAVDYNMFVDEILNSTQNSTPETGGDEEALKVYQSYKSKSKIMMTAKQDDDSILVRPEPIVYYTHGQVERIEPVNNSEVPRTKPKHKKR